MSDLGTDLLHLLTESYKCDMTVVCEGGKRLEVHKLIVAARSNVFRTMLDVDMKERESGSVEIKDFDPVVVTEFFQFLYSAQISEDFTNLTSLLQMGHQYQVPSLVKQCTNRLALEISAENVAELGSLAENYELSELTEACTRFLAKNFENLEPENLETLPPSLTWKSCKSAFASLKEKLAIPQLAPIKVDGVKTTYMANLFGELGQPTVVQADSSIQTIISVRQNSLVKLVGVGLYLNEGRTPVTLTCTWDKYFYTPVTVNTTVTSTTYNTNYKIPVKIPLPNPVPMYDFHGRFKLVVKFGAACYYLKGTNKKENYNFRMNLHSLQIDTHDDCQIPVLYFEV